MKAIIFGSNGQDGYFLSNLLTEKSIEVIKVSRSKGDYLGCVSDFEFVNTLISKYKPDYIFHFAANSTTSHDALFENHNTISTGTINILESVKNHCPHSKVFLSGSAMQFKNSGLPISESTEFESSSPYSFARIHSTYVGRYYRNKFNLKVYCGYFFNHDSQLRTERHINQKIVEFIKQIPKNNNAKLEIGDIDVKKEFNFAGDIVNAVWILVNQDIVSEAVIGSGVAHSIREWTDYCFKSVGKNYKDYVVTNNNFTTEYNILVSNPSKIKSIGWKPSLDMCALADLMMKSH